jgi:hypothetical protein
MHGKQEERIWRIIIAQRLELTHMRGHCIETGTGIESGCNEGKVYALTIPQQYTQSMGIC